MSTTTNFADVRHAADPPALLPTRPFYWSVQRELWEFRSIYLAPLIVAGVFLFGFLISLFYLPSKLRAADAMQQHKIIQQPYDLGAGAVMAATFLVALFYCLECLHGERRDRSILFWKSLPIPDLMTVLAKACVPIIILPLLDFVLTVIMQCVMAGLGGMASASAVGMSGYLGELHLGRMWMYLLYHLVAIHALWFAPFYGWMIFVSAWARRAPLLWATVPLLAVGILERIAFGNSSLGSLLTYRITGSPNGVPFSDGNMAMDHSMHVLPFWQFMLSPGVWFGLLVTAGFLYAAARIRRQRGPI